MDSSAVTDVPIPEPLGVRRDEQAHDRMTRICDAMVKTFDAHLEQREGDRVIIFIEDDGRAGIVINGYEDDYVAIIALLMHLRAIFRANGQDIELIAIPDSPEGLDND